MTGTKLRLIGALCMLLGLVGLLSGWALLASAEGALYAVVHFALVGIGMLLIYQGENRQHRNRH